MAVGVAAGRAVWACALLALVCAQNDVRQPPTITAPTKEETIYVPKESAFSLQCSAEGKPSPTFKWTRDGKAIVNDEYKSYNSATGLLTFPSFSKREEGIYQCTATNVFDETGERRKAASMSYPIKLMRQYVGEFTDFTEVQMKGTQYSYQVLHCDNKGIIQLADPGFSWYSGEKTDQLTLEEGRQFIDENGHLHFAYLKLEDANVYWCGVSNQRTSIALGTPNRLAVTPATRPTTAVKPQLQYSNNGVKALLYTDVELECLYSGYDPTDPHYPAIKWYDDASKEFTPGANHPKYSLGPKGNKLRIKNVQETDEKNYYCQGENSGGKSRKDQVFLDLKSPPIFRQPNGAPKGQTKPENEDVVFHCNARSLANEPVPRTPVWYINGEKTGHHNDPNKYTWTADKKKLTIHKVEKALDIQCVQCTVDNDAGTLWGDGCLNVILPITLTTKPPQRQVIKKGDVVDLTITATADPSATLVYQWEFNNKTYLTDPPPLVNYDANTFAAFINTSDLTTEEFKSIGGIYRRIIYHSNDRLTYDVEVVLEGITPAPVVSKGGIDMWIIGLIIGILFLIIVIIIIIFVVCRKKQEGDYNVDKKETGAGLDPEKELKEKGFDDYSRPTYDDYEYPEKKPRGELEYDDVPIGGDDESLAEYGDEADMHFNEDGSFIGVYQNNKNGPRGPKSTESTI